MTEAFELSRRLIDFHKKWMRLACSYVVFFSENINFLDSENRFLFVNRLTVVVARSLQFTPSTIVEEKRKKIFRRRFIMRRQRLLSILFSRDMKPTTPQSVSYHQIVQFASL
jgi:hypothetical protein